MVRYCTFPPPRIRQRHVAFYFLCCLFLWYMFLVMVVHGTHYRGYGTACGVQYVDARQMDNRALRAAFTAVVFLYVFLCVEEGFRFVNL